VAGVGPLTQVAIWEAFNFGANSKQCKLFLYHENLGSQISMRKKKFLTHFRVLELILGIPKKKKLEKNMPKEKTQLMQFLQIRNLYFGKNI
jgi:hypothetical protein